MSKAPSIQAGMYFSFGNTGRKGIKSKNTFEAILNKERRSTTRFKEDGLNQFYRFKTLKTGDTIQFWEKPWKNGSFHGRSLIVEIESIQILNFNDMSPEKKELWSQQEGWDESFINVFLQKGKTSGLQIIYKLIQEPIDLQEKLF